MTASKVIISPETRSKLSNPAISAEKKLRLREELIKNYIRNSPGGVATKQELGIAAGFDADATSASYARGHSLIGSMVRRKIISHNATVERRKTWVVNEDVRTVKPAPKDVAAAIVTPEVETPQPEAAPKETTKEAMVELKEFPGLTSISLQEMAKEFAWRRNSDSLREFIEYVKDAIK